jgi:hypothetical protein
MKKTLLKFITAMLFVAFTKNAAAQVPVANFSINPTTICTGGTVHITDMSSNTPTSWSYTLVGSTPSVTTLQNPTPTIYGAGVHTVILMSANASGTSAAVSHTFLVNPLPMMSIIPSAPGNTVCLGASSVLTATGATTYSWAIGPTTPSCVITPTAAYTIYWVNGVALGCTNAATIGITTVAAPTLAIATNPPGPLGICVGKTATLTASGALTYTWTSGPTTNTYAVTPPVTTSYTVTGSNAAGCTANAITTLNVRPNPTITIVASPSVVCIGNTSTLTASGATSYTWTAGPPAASMTVSPTSPTMYSVSGSSVGCISTASITIGINTTPSVTAISSSTVICSGSTATLSGSGATTYTWNPGLLTGNSIAISPTASTIYTVSGGNACGISSSTINLGVNANPVVNAVTSASIICAGQTSTLTASGASTYTWNTSSNSAAINVTPTTTTNYTVTGTNSNGCLNSTVITQSVTICTGITNNTNNSIVGIYPNPNNGMFNVEFSNSNSTSEIVIMNMIGQKVYTQTIVLGTNNINANGLSKGIYHYVILQNKEVTTNGKLIIE